MNISAVNRVQNSDVRTKTDRMGVFVAQRAIEAARQNQGVDGAEKKTGVAKSFAHPYLGHNVDIYV